ncbi:response regulator transcription factor [Paenibacillus sp. J22TS3]|uniref:response regulator transcription factor n=1 Tax=Paenibacillus sp. J22TS3 TaxID=2807192 RepID=UPI001B28AFB4|nr:response regulator transcription factor [Paenibacillus sp. J22TS3]GIP24355.1 AraC family transcriptional regulator [Paenibacillus sp. J22TS3]
MIKVVIVDDEPKLRQGLQTLIPWEQLGFTVTATAANGQEALEVIKEETPDLAIVDIRMPLMDGLELIRNLTTSGHQMHFIILSGYADFEYAKMAIKYGVTGYILKPVDTEEMAANLKRVRERIEEERMKRAQPFVEAVNPRWLLHQLLDPQEKAIESAKLISMAEEADLLWSSYEVIAVLPQVPEAGRADALYRLSEAWRPLIEGEYRGAVTLRPPYAILLLQEPLRGRQRREKLYRELRSSANGLRFTAATGGAVSSPEEIGHSYLKAQESIQQAFFGEKGRLLGPIPPVYPLPEPDWLSSDGDTEEITEQIIFRLYYSLDVGNHSGIRPLLDEAAAFFLRQGQDEKVVKESFFFLTNAVIHKLTEGSHKKLMGTETVSRFLNGILQYEVLDDLLEETHRFLLALAEDAGPGGKEQELKKMISFIHRHYAENLRLDTLAGLLNYSTAYLGQLFKNKTGEYFNTYLDRVRIEKAKELLGQGMKVYEVAERVGYTNVNYFHSKFKRYEGRSPSDYKNP